MTEIRKVQNEPSSSIELSDKPTKQAKIALIVLFITLISSLLLAGFSGTIGKWGNDGGKNVFIRVTLGLSLGYILVRSYFGFAGSINRSMRGNSLKLMRAIMFTFGLTSILIGFMYMGNMLNISDSRNAWWNNEISLGLAIGAILFGFGMALASAWASGGLTDGAWNPTKMFIVVLSFGLGVFLAFPIQYGAKWTGGPNGSLHNLIYDGNSFNFNLDIIKEKPVYGVLVGVLITTLLCLIVVVITKIVDILFKHKGKEINSFDEKDFSKEWTRSELKITHTSLYAKMIERPLTLIEGAIAMSIIFIIMVFLTHDAWGVSTPYGLWIGQALSTLNIVSADRLAIFTGMPAGAFSQSLTSNANGMQNIGIFIGGTIAALSMNKYSPTFKVSIKEAVLWTIGGIFMGVGTRLSGGCNVGALYSPIAFGSASGWVFFVFMVAGAIIGNIIFKKVK